jgi:hypothetical protein
VKQKLESYENGIFQWVDRKELDKKIDIPLWKYFINSLIDNKPFTEK